MSKEDINRRYRFYKHVNIGWPNVCWEWNGPFFSKKLPLRGQFWWGEINGKDKTVSASRAIWIIENGEITNGLHVLHRCNNSKCVNVSHLYLGTHENNMRDRDECGRTSKGAHRYNFLRTEELTNKVKEMRSKKTKIADIMSELGVSRNTIYRCLGMIK